MKKKISLVLLFFAVALVYAKAETALVLSLTNGEKVSVLLNKQPSLGFNGSNLKVTAAEVVAEYPLENIANMTFEGNSTAIETLQMAEKGNISIDLTSQNAMTVRGGIAGRSIIVAGVDGRQYKVRVNKADNSATVDLSTLATGQYIVNIEGLKAFKVLKK